MNYAQKLGYIVVGGVIATVGMIVASVFSPNLIAQNEIVDRIRCKSLVVHDEEGNAAVFLSTNENGGLIGVNGKGGMPVVFLSAEGDGGRVDVKDGETGYFAVSVLADEDGGRVRVSE